MRKKHVIVPSLLLVVFIALGAVAWRYGRWRSYDAAHRALQKRIVTALDDYHRTHKQFPDSLALISLDPLPPGVTTDMLAHAEYVCAPKGVSPNNYYQLTVRWRAFGFRGGEINSCTGRFI